MSIPPPIRTLTSAWPEVMSMSKTKLQNDFELFREHCVIIRRDYNTYNDLFFSGQDALLIKTALTFFNDIAEIMQRDWILQICKLMDPAETNRKGEVLENISIELINSQLKSAELMSDEISLISCALKKYGRKIVPARNKRLAHIDRSHQISADILGQTTKEELDSFLMNIQQYCDLVGQEIGLGPLDFSYSGCKGDVLDLLKVLRKYYENI